MISNYLKIAFRSLKKSFLFSVLNIAGLSVGLSVFILLFLFVSQEFSFDAMFKKRDQIYRVLLHSEMDGWKGIWASVPNAVGPAFRSDIPSAKLTARMYRYNFGESVNIKTATNVFIENNFYWADPELTRIFDFQTVKGDIRNALQEPGSVIISESKARKYFGDENPIGKLIKADNYYSLTVNGVYKDLPNNSSLDAEMIGSYATTGFARENTWDNASFETWILLEKGTDVANVEKQLEKILEKNITKDKRWYTLSLQELSKVHLYSSGIESYSGRPAGNIHQVKQLSVLALLILVIATINYMNLATAKAQQRAKDVGINKTLGASRAQLIGRFYLETGILTLAALVLGTLLAVVFIPVFNSLSEKTLLASDLLQAHICLGMLLLWMITTISAGAYPAFILSGFSPFQAMYQKRSPGNSSVALRKSLVIFQFAVSVILIVSVIIIYQQMNYVANKNLGYNPENVLAVSTGAARDEAQINTLTNKYRQLENVEEICSGQALPGRGESGRLLMRGPDDKRGIALNTNSVSGNFIKVLQLKLLAGRLLTERAGKTDSIVQVVVNKTATEYLGLSPEAAIGHKIDAQLGNNAYIVGVVDDFNFRSLHTPMGAYAFHNRRSEPLNVMMIRFKTGNLNKSMKLFGETFKETIPDAVFEYTFLDKYVESLYRADQKAGYIALAFSFLAIFIGCLGLFGLAAFMAEQRVKEIGVRKVLGASVNSIIRLLSSDFMKLVFLSIIIACPVAWYIMNEWLNDFAYRVTVQWWVFALSGLLAIIITLFTVSFQAIKAATANPVKSLKAE